MTHAPKPGGDPRSETTPGRTSLRRIDRYIQGSTSRWGLVLLLTLSTTATHPPRGSTVATPIMAVLGIVLLRRLAWEWRYWGLLTAITAIGVLSHPLVDLDNHHFLHVYWLLAITLACLTTDPKVTLARTGRLLIGWLFVFATAWKLLTPDFVDGSFLTYLLSVDSGMAEVPILLGWQDSEAVAENRSAVAARQRDPQVELEPVRVEVAPNVDRVARPLSILTVVLEAAVALSFLLPLRGRWTRFRDASLLTFVLVTYTVVPVLSFAALLVAMSLASSTLRPPWLQVIHVVLFLTAASGALLLQGGQP